VNCAWWPGRKELSTEIEQHQTRVPVTEENKRNVTERETENADNIIDI
jgi:hypothetical protein